MRTIFRFTKEHWFALLCCAIVCLLLFVIGPTVVRLLLAGPNKSWWHFWVQTLAGNWSADLWSLVPHVVTEYEFALSAIIAIVWNNLLIAALLALIWGLTKGTQAMRIADAVLLKEVYIKKAMRDAYRHNPADFSTEERLSTTLSKAFALGNAQLFKTLPAIADDPAQAQDILEDLREGTKSKVGADTVSSAKAPKKPR